MKTLKTITHADFGETHPKPEKYIERQAVRAVVFDEVGKIALIYSQKNSFHKMPGGGVEEGENFETALRRELIEEIGCVVEDIQELGIIEEFRDKFSFHHISYCYTAKVIEKGTPQLEEYEIEEGFITRWYELADAIATIELEGKTLNEKGKFMQMRELTILREVSSSKF